MAYLIGLNCKCCDCGGPLGLSVRLLSECLVREEFPDNEISETDANALLERVEASGPFVKFSLTLDPTTMTLHFPLWCPSCGEVKNTSISVEDIKELARMPEKN